MFGHDDNSQQPGDSQAGQGASFGNNNQGMSLPAADDAGSNLLDNNAPASVATPMQPGAASSASSSTDMVQSSSTTNVDELLDIKQQALQQLTPLIGHLEQSPEEKFRTTMMMIQASDNDALIKAAYDAATAISDEKVRAQALLDIVNEINYFTHNNNSEA